MSQANCSSSTAENRCTDAELRRTLADRSIAEPLLAQGAEVSPSTPEELGRLMREENARWTKVIKTQNLKF